MKKGFKVQRLKDENCKKTFFLNYFYFVVIRKVYSSLTPFVYYLPSSKMQNCADFARGQKRAW